jgi:hypothetical protein
MLESFQAFQMCRSEQSNELKNIIRNDIIPTFRELLRKQLNTEKLILNEAKTEAKNIDQYIDRISKVKKKLIIFVGIIYYAHSLYRFFLTILI